MLPDAKLHSKLMSWRLQAAGPSKESLLELQQRLQQHLTKQLEANGAIATDPEPPPAAKELKRPQAIMLKGAKLASGAPAAKADAPKGPSLHPGPAAEGAERCPRLVQACLSKRRHARSNLLSFPASAKLFA